MSGKRRPTKKTVKKFANAPRASPIACSPLLSNWMPHVFRKNVLESHLNVTLGGWMNERKLEVLWSFIVSAFILGGLLGALLAGFIANRIGRKGALMLDNALGILAAVCFAFVKTSSPFLLLVGRILAGAGSGGSILGQYLVEKRSEAIFMPPKPPLPGVRRTCQHSGGRILKEEVKKMKHATSCKQLIQKLKNAWVDLNPGIRKSVVRSMPQQMQLVIYMKRDYIRLACGTVTLYLTELGPKAWSGPLGVILPLGISMGILVSQVAGLSNILGNEGLWDVLLSATGILKFLTASVLLFCPESPVFIGEQKRKLGSKTKRRLCVSSVKVLLRGDEKFAADTEEREIMVSVVVPVKERCRKCLASISLPLILVISLNVGQQTSGINAMMFYSTAIFRSAGLSVETSQYASLSLGFINLVMAILAVPLLARFKRRTLLLTSVGCFIPCLFLLTLSMHFMDRISWCAFSAIAIMGAFVMSFGLGMGPIPFLVGSELLRSGEQAMGLALGAFANFFTVFFVGLLFPLMQISLGEFSFLVFGAISTLFAVFWTLRFPETKPI
ncbi:unnamed protein product [Darwinula stevensoni]|uniref:Major facilitator superfamily (MFS) profile domain-containing protein n=1 Tax=Darwinula stevensoni TaxID=69355 RepID=A0A7R8X8N1_9CRUS|nr:unnamed protein product [Darwinula stevensoni]CAG0884631.1 unnamed protein product [Darwinula stevensoni]